MKRLFLRFFDDATKQIPVNSEFICTSLVGSNAVGAEIQNWGDEIALWMKRNPDGKTDFVWLS